MQIFLPYKDFRETAKCLDMKRLGKQRVEAWQILGVLTGRNKFVNWPIVRMWKGFEISLCAYGIHICEEWKSRGYKDTMLERFEKVMDELLYDKKEIHDWKYPPFIGDEEFHNRHKATLLFKKPEYYSKFGWKVEPKKENMWAL